MRTHLTPKLTRLLRWILASFMAIGGALFVARLFVIDLQPPELTDLALAAFTMGSAMWSSEILLRS